MRILFLYDKYLIEPLGIGYLSAIAKLHGFETDIVKTREEDYIERVREFRPDILAYSVTTGRQRYFFEINKEIRQYFHNWKMLSLFGGPHFTFFPQEIENRGREYYIDVVAQGECDQAFSDFILKYRNSDGDIDSVSHIENFWVRLDTTVVKNPLRHLTKDIDSIPFPDRALLYKYKKNAENPIRSVIFSAQCPYSCTYCYVHTLRHKTYADENILRIRSIDNCMAEMHQLKSDWPNTQLVYCQDDIMPIYKKDFIVEFLERYEREIGIPLHIQTRVEFLTHEIGKLFKTTKMIHGVTFAIESGNQDIRFKVLERRMTDEQILEGASILHKYGIKFRVENMLGVPGETFKNTLQTLDINLKIKPTFSWTSLFQPYVQTKLGDEAIKQGLFDGNPDDLGEDFFHKLFIKLKDRKKIDRLQKIFSIIVAFPFLRKLVPLLVRLPIDRFYWWLYKRWKLYMYDNRLYNIQDGQLKDKKFIDEIEET